ncbi:MAG: hypothetical protein LBJ08_11900 [Bifidobacteriaceae bacterium]|nr:hypothetical protein [Bifidobacteriaceae bacterium]
MVATDAGRGVHRIGRTAGWDAIDQAISVDTDRKWMTTASLRGLQHGWTGALQDLLPT